jgi:hypothetical protein
VARIEGWREEKKIDDQQKIRRLPGRRDYTVNSIVDDPAVYTVNNIM